MENIKIVDAHHHLWDLKNKNTKYSWLMVSEGEAFFGDYAAIRKNYLLEDYIEDLLIKGGNLSDPTVTVRLLNAKVTVLGEVKSPGTFNFTENKLSLLQVLGLAGDLNINADRQNIIILRTVDGVQKNFNIDLTTVSWLESEYSYVLPNDIIVIRPNSSKVKKAGYVGDSSVVLSIVSTILSAILIITNL